LRGKTVLGLFCDQEIDEGQSFWLIDRLGQQLSIAMVIKSRIRLTHRTRPALVPAPSVSQVESESKCVVPIVRDVMQIQRPGSE
jgi:hypothetical protein